MTDETDDDAVDCRACGGTGRDMGWPCIPCGGTARADAEDYVGMLGAGLIDADEIRRGGVPVPAAEVDRIASRLTTDHRPPEGDDHDRHDHAAG